MKEKVAFVHFAKSAGRFVNNYMVNHVCNGNFAKIARQGTKYFNSYSGPFHLGRDWKETELFEFAIDRSPHQIPSEQDYKLHSQHWQHGYLDRQFIHNHQYGWTPRAIHEFKRNGWFIFTFLRDPAELICSLYWWSQDQVLRGVDPNIVFKPVELLYLSLDEFMAKLLTGHIGLRRYFALPEFVDQIDYVAEFTEENFRAFLLTHFDHQYQADTNNQRERWRSTNKGIDHYVSTGEIRPQTIELLKENAEVNRLWKYCGYPVNWLSAR